MEVASLCKAGRKSLARSLLLVASVWLFFRSWISKLEWPLPASRLASFRCCYQIVTAFTQLLGAEPINIVHITLCSTHGGRSFWRKSR